MKKKALWITETAVMLALLIALQAVTKPMGQLVTGSAVNAVLAVTVLLCGISSGMTVALLSPVFAFLFGIAPNLVTVPAIMIGNTVYVLLLHKASGKSIAKMVIAVLAAALAKFAVLYVLVTYVICGVLAQPLLDQGLLKQPMLKALPASFAAPQLVTALVGGTLANLIVTPLKKALHR